MIIHATKKAQPLFSYLTHSQDVNEAKRRSNQNPLNSWHANYFNVNRKKMLLLVNNASLYTVLVPDVNAIRKKELSALIFEALERQLKVDGLPNSLTQPYLEQLGDIEVATGYNRKVTSTSNHFIQMLQGVSWGGRKAISSSEQASYLNSAVVLSLKHTIPTQELLAWLNGEEQSNVDKELIFNGEVKIDKTWDDFSAWQEKSNQVEHQGLNPITLEENYISHSENLMNGFRIYLEKKEHLSDKVIRRHVNNVAIFMEFLLITALYTPFRDEVDVTNYFCWLIDKGVVMSDYAFNGQIAALKKFYQFLFYMNEIDEKGLKAQKANIKEAKEIIFDLLS